MKRLVVALFVTAAALVAATTSSGAASAPESGLTLVTTASVSSRLTDFTFTTKAVPQWPTRVRVMLPTNYDRSGRTRYPVLYLLHGAIGYETDWTAKGDAVNATKNYPYIVVMPECHENGNFADWWNFGNSGAPQWETYLVEQLVPWIDRHYPTSADRFHRAVAGLSMGGGGAMTLAAHHPDVFSAAGSFSGTLDNTQVLSQVLLPESSVQASLRPNAMYGHYLTDEVRWRGDNPVDLAGNLRGLLLDVTTGNGNPGGPARDTGDPVEMFVYPMNTAFHARLATLGIPHTWNPYGSGGHAWWYWARALTQFLPMLQRYWNGAAPDTSSFDYRSIDANYTVYGWSVAIARKATEFSRLSVRPDGFSLTGSGRAVVTAPDGRRFDLDLGPANPFQQYSPRAKAWLLATNRGHAWPARQVDVSRR